MYSLAKGVAFASGEVLLFGAVATGAESSTSTDLAFTSPFTLVSMIHTISPTATVSPSSTTILITPLTSAGKAKVALSEKADYLAFGAFGISKTKKVKYKASINTLKKVKKITNKPIVVIGGINPNNYQKLLLNNANFLAISGYIWKNKKMKPAEAINKFI